MTELLGRTFGLSRTGGAISNSRGCCADVAASVRLLAFSPDIPSQPPKCLSAAVMLAAAVTCLVAPGCGNKPARPAYEVYGRVLVNGQPAEGVCVQLIPLGKTSGTGGIAVTDDQGQFDIVNSLGQKGVDEGEYQVVYSKIELLNQDERAGVVTKETLPAEYSDPNHRRPPVFVAPGGIELNSDLVVPES